LVFNDEGWEKVKYLGSFLFTPGSDLRKIQKAFELNANSIILDLEDSVAPSQKEIARENVSNSLKIDRGKKRVGVRINGIETKYWVLDIKETIKEGPDFYMIPKVNNSNDVYAVERVIESFEQLYELKDKTDLIVTIENAIGFSNIYEIVKASERIKAISFGRADFCSDVGCESDNQILFYPRLLTSIAAAIVNISAIDTVYLNFRDLEGLEREAREAKAMGYLGKAAIHPNQVDVINKVFTPSEKEIEWAKKVYTAYEDAIKRGLGAISVDNQMIDEAVVKKARRVLSFISNI
jgi:citrate lyase subunit beta/citryl-CoA lyase